MLDATKVKDHYSSQFARLEQRLNGESRLPLHELRRAAFARFASMPFPTTRFEEWKYTNVESLLNLPFESYEGRVTVKDAEKFFWHATPAYRLVFINGRYSPELSEIRDLPGTVTIGSLEDNGKKDPEKVSALAGRLPYADDNIFAEMNNAFLSDGLFLRIAKGAVIEKPVQCLFLSVPDTKPLLVQPRNLVFVGAGAQVNITEQYATLGSGAHFTNAVTQLVVETEAILDYQKVQNEHPDAYHVALTHMQMSRNSRLRATTVTLGARLTRNVVHTVLEDEGIEATLNGLYLTDGRQHADHRTFIDHAKPHCASHELYKGILGGQSTGVFNGKILVRPDAQKTDAKQSNHSLLLSENAAVNTKPQLEIFADDVKCTHGATIGRLDEEAMFYLRSRGLSRDAARNILTYAFAGEIVERIAVPALREHLDALLKQRLTH